MDSNEEYLDQLLKSLTEDSSSALRESDDSDDGIEDLLNQFSEDMHNVPEELFSGLLDGSDSTPEDVSLELPSGLDSISEEVPDEQPGDLGSSIPEEIPDEVFGSLDNTPEEVSEEQPDDWGGILEEMPDEQSVGQDSMPEEEFDDVSADLESMLKEMAGEVSDDSDDALQDILGKEETAFLSDLNATESTAYEMSAADEESDDLGSLLESLGAEGDEDVQEISDLLTKAENDEPIVDMMDSLSQEISDEADEQPKKRRKKKKERVKKEKKPRRGRKKQGIQNIADNLPEEYTDNVEGVDEIQLQEMDALLATGVAQGQKKQGFWGKLLNTLTLEEEDPEDPADLISDENGAILEQLDQEEKNKAKGKKKKAQKKGKGKKSADINEDEELDEEVPDAKKKKKKEKKPKKEKPPVSVEELLPGKKLPIKKVLSIVLVTLAFCVAYVVISHLYIGHVNKRQAENAYYAGDYLECYGLLFGQELNESQALMYHKSELNLQMERMKGNYQRLVLEGKELEALDYLVQFICRREEFYSKGQEWGCLDVVEETYSGMTSLLIVNYGLNEERAIEIAALRSDVDYTIALVKVLEEFHGPETADAEGQDQQPVYEDLLPEEEEISDTEFVDSIG